MNDIKWIAIREFCQACTIPIIAENEKEAGVEGTGILFEINDNAYLITAYHVAKRINEHPDNLGIPTGKTKSEVYTFMDCEIIFPKQEQDRTRYDAALVCLSRNPRLCDTLRENYSYLTLDNIGSYHNIPTNYLLAGYPSKLSKNLSNFDIFGKFFMLITPPFTGQLNKNVNNDPSYDIFLSYGKSIVDELGNTVEAPELDGISGGSIWSIKPDSRKDAFWSAKDSVELVGVDVSYSTPTFKYIRGLRWNVVAHLFSDIDPYSKNLIIEKIGSD